MTSQFNNFEQYATFLIDWEIEIKELYENAIHYKSNEMKKHYHFQACKALTTFVEQLVGLPIKYNTPSISLSSLNELDIESLTNTSSSTEN